jgi:hypothetical protein
MPVGSFPPNAWGLHDMHGNVMEWCADWTGEYPLETATDPEGPATGSKRILRGGSWDAYARVARSANRLSQFPVIRTDTIGFRVVHDPEGVVPQASDLTAPRIGSNRLRRGPNRLRPSPLRRGSRSTRNSRTTSRGPWSRRGCGAWDPTRWTG